MNSNNKKAASGTVSLYRRHCPRGIPQSVIRMCGRFVVALNKRRLFGSVNTHRR